MTVANQRPHNRVKHQANIQVVANAESYNLEMRDFSDSGLYLFCENTCILIHKNKLKFRRLNSMVCQSLTLKLCVQKKILSLPLSLFNKF